MGRKVKGLSLTDFDKEQLEEGYKKGKGTFSQRCQIILLKVRGNSSKSIAEFLNINYQSVNNWVKRYEQEGIEGLRTRAGRGRPSTFKPSDEKLVREVVQRERQRLKKAKELLETELNKDFCVETLRRFLKNLSVDGNESV